MWQLWAGAALLAGPHLFSTVLPVLRDRLKIRMGEGAFKGLYSLVTFAGIGLLVWAYIAGRTGDLGSFYEPPVWARHVTMLLALVGIILLGASHGKGYIKSFVKHPMSLGIALWSVGHLLANGEKAVVVIFSSLLLIGLADIVFSLARGKGPQHEPRLRSDIIAVVVGVVVYALLVFVFHPYVIQVPVV